MKYGKIRKIFRKPKPKSADKYTIGTPNGSHDLEEKNTLMYKYAKDEFLTEKDENKKKMVIDAISPGSPASLR